MEHIFLVCNSSFTSNFLLRCYCLTLGSKVYTNNNKKKRYIYVDSKNIFLQLRTSFFTLTTIWKHPAATRGLTNSLSTILPEKKMKRRNKCHISWKTVDMPELLRVTHRQKFVSVIKM